jgi:hypothetical protein
VGEQASHREAFHPGEKLPSIGYPQTHLRGRVKRLKQNVNDESPSAFPDKMVVEDVSCEHETTYLRASLE